MGVLSVKKADGSIVTFTTKSSVTPGSNPNSDLAIQTTSGTEYLSLLYGDPLSFEEKTLSTALTNFSGICESPESPGNFYLFEWATNQIYKRDYNFSTNTLGARSSVYSGSFVNLIPGKALKLSDGTVLLACSIANTMPSGPFSVLILKRSTAGAWSIEKTYSVSTLHYCSICEYSDGSVVLFTNNGSTTGQYAVRSSGGSWSTSFTAISGIVGNKIVSFYNPTQDKIYFYDLNGNDLQVRTWDGSLSSAVSLGTFTPPIYTWYYLNAHSLSDRTYLIFVAGSGHVRYFYGVQHFLNNNATTKYLRSVTLASTYTDVSVTYIGSTRYQVPYQSSTASFNYVDKLGYSTYDGTAAGGLEVRTAYGYGKVMQE